MKINYFIKSRYILLFCLLLVVFMFPGISRSSLSFQFEGNAQHHNFTSSHLGTFSVHVGQRIIAPPSMDKSMLVVSTGKIAGSRQSGQVVALNGSTGHILWRTRLPNLSMTQPLFTKGLVIVGMGGKRMFTVNGGYSCRSRFVHGIIALNRHNGKVVWMHLTRCQVMPTPVYVHHDILGPTGGGHFIALSANNGRLLWEIPIGGWSAMSSPSRSGAQVFFGTDNSFTDQNLFYDINWKKHRIVWSHNFRHVVNLAEASPVLDNGIVFTAFMHNSYYSPIQLVAHLWNCSDMRDYTFQVVGMRSTNGDIVYHKTIDVKYLAPRAWLKDRIVSEQFYWKNWFVTAFLKVANALNIPVTLSNLNKSVPETAGIYDPPLTAWHNLIFVEPRLTGRLYALDDKSENVLWSVKTGEDVSNPNIYHGHLYLVNARGVLFVIKATNGQVILTKKLSTGTLGPGNGLLSAHHFVAGGASGELVSLQPLNKGGFS